MKKATHTNLKKAVIERTGTKRSKGRTIHKHEAFLEDDVGEDIQKVRHVAVVTVGPVGITRNCGDGDFLKASISIAWPCRPTEKSVRRTYKKVSKMVSQLLEAEFHSLEELTTAEEDQPKKGKH